MRYLHLIVIQCHAYLSQLQGSTQVRLHIPFLRRSGFPFLTVAMTISPHAAAGRRLSLEPHPTTEITYRFLAPVLSAQFITAPTGRASAMANLLPEVPPRPRLEAILATPFFQKGVAMGAPLALMHGYAYRSRRCLRKLGGGVGGVTLEMLRCSDVASKPHSNKDVVFSDALKVSGSTHLGPASHESMMDFEALLPRPACATTGYRPY
jgi:hypothetical protein